MPFSGGGKAETTSFNIFGLESDASSEAESCDEGSSWKFITELVYVRLLAFSESKKSKLSAVLDALFSSSESKGDEYPPSLLLSMDKSFTLFNTDSCLNNHRASSLLSTQSAPVKSSWTLEKASMGSPPFSSPFNIDVGASGGGMLSMSPKRT